MSVPLSDVIGVWVAVACTLFLFSFLYRDNPLYKVGENLFVGVSMGYYTVRYWYDTVNPKLVQDLADGSDLWMLAPLVMTALFFLRFIRSAAWMSRYAFAALLGIVSGLAIPRFITSNILTQMEATMKPVWGWEGLAGMGSKLATWSMPVEVNAILIVLGVVTVLTYFFYSVEHRGPVKAAATTGIYFLMVSFGTSFGLTVMGRVSLLIGRCDDLILYSGGDYGYATPILLAGTALALLLWERKDRQKVSPPAAP